MPPAIAGQGGVVGIVQFPAAGEQPGHENHHGRQPHQFTDWQLKRLEAPAVLQLMAGLGQCQAQPVALAGAFSCQRPPSPENAVGHQWGEQVAGPLAKTVEAVRIIDAPFLPGDCRSGTIKRHLLEPGGGWRSDRHPDAGAAAAIGIDHQVHRRATGPAGVGVEGKVLQPDPRMKQVGLVPPHDNRRSDPVGGAGGAVGVAVAGGVFKSHRQQLPPGGGDQLPELEIADPGVEGGPQQSVVIDQLVNGKGGVFGAADGWRVE